MEFVPLQLGYVGVFGATTLGCFVAAYRARRFDDPDTRWGLVSLLALFGLWAAFETGRLLVPAVAAKHLLYLLGLTVGLASGWSWFQFTSAYSGHDYHRRPVVRRTALVVFVVGVALKFTNPLHGVYYTARVEAVPFPHLVVVPGVFHWLLTGLLYAVAAVGFYLLFGLFADSHFSTTSLGILLVVTALPAVLDLVSFTGVTGLLTLNYEPIGVAIFGFWALFFAEETFTSVRGFGRQQVIHALSEAVILVDREERIRDFNDPATEYFPAILEGVGEPIDDVLPQLSAPDGIGAGDTLDVVTVERDGRSSHYGVVVTPLRVGPHTIGRAYVLVDVTEVERQRTALRRQNEQFDGFAAAVSHELRNAMMVVRGNIEATAARLDEVGDETAIETLTTALDATDRAIVTIADLAKLARYSQQVTETEPHDIGETVTAVWEWVDGDEIPLTVARDGSIEADGPRLEELFRTVARFARGNEAAAVTVTATDDGFTVTIEGETLGGLDTATLFEFGTAVPNAETGMLAAVVQTLVRAHGWEVEASTDEGGAFQFVVTGATVTPDA